MVATVVVKISTIDIVMGSICSIDSQDYGIEQRQHFGKNVNVLIPPTNQTFVLKIHLLVIMYVMEI